jgi:AraC-like DNA-binding protein
VHSDLEQVQLAGWVSPIGSFSMPVEFSAPLTHHCFFGITKGSCRSNTFDHPLLPSLRQGDFVMLNHEIAGSIAPGIENQSRESPVQKRSATNKSDAPLAPIISGGFVARNGPSASLLAAFPPVLVIQGSAGEFRPWIDRLLQLLLAEASPEHPGTGDVVNRLLGVLFVKTVQHALDSSYPGSEKFLRDCRDDDVGVALCRLHERPDFPWTVASLAEEAHLTRSTFAARFLLAVGKPPLQYLRDVRMQRASLLLRERRHSLKQIAALAGYRTPSAFSAAFRRSTGKSPGEFRWSFESSSSR